jgi:hypothetical protein
MSHAQDWRRRAQNHKGNVASLLVERALQGMGFRVLEPEVLHHPELYGRRPPNRICELRKAGWKISGKEVGSGDFFYWLQFDGDGNSYPQTRRFDEPPNCPKPQLVAQPLLKTTSLFDVRPVPKSWEQVCAERDEKMRQPEPEFELTP